MSLPIVWQFFQWLSFWSIVPTFLCVPVRAALVSKLRRCQDYWSVDYPRECVVFFKERLRGARQDKLLQAVPCLFNLYLPEKMKRSRVLENYELELETTEKINGMAEGIDQPETAHVSSSLFKGRDNLLLSAIRENRPAKPLPKGPIVLWWSKRNGSVSC